MIELQGSTGMRLNVIVFVVWLGRFAGVTMIPWEMGKQLMCDVTDVDALAPSRLNQGSSCHPGTTEIEERKIRAR